MDSYKLFLDDERIPPECYWMDIPTYYDSADWKIVRNYEQFCAFIEQNWENNKWPSIVSFDHDLADEHYVKEMYESKEAYEEKAKSFVEKTGTHCAKFLAEFCIDKDLPVPEILVHSKNDIGKLNIYSIFTTLKKFRNNGTH